ncbi:MAG: thermonuclease family protein [Candidatus Omnitrophica bacterium]|nr:thermonuclease family protein [Candidatus Omnitrophota bacterium]
MRAPITLAMVLAAVMAATGQWVVHQKSGPRAVSAGPAGNEAYRVAYVNDGDTIKLNNGERVRLIGIDTPETHDNQKLSKDVARRRTSRKTQLAMGEKAAGFTRALVQGRDVRLEYDVERRDHYRRLLAYVYLSDGTFVNEKIIREGYAYPLTVPPNVRYADRFKQWFDEARQNRRGLWQ